MPAQGAIDYPVFQDLQVFIIDVRCAYETITFVYEMW